MAGPVKGGPAGNGGMFSQKQSRPIDCTSGRAQLQDCFTHTTKLALVSPAVETLQGGVGARHCTARLEGRFRVEGQAGKECSHFLLHDQSGPPRGHILARRAGYVSARPALLA